MPSAMSHMQFSKTLSESRKTQNSILIMKFIKIQVSKTIQCTINFMVATGHDLLRYLSLINSKTTSETTIIKNKYKFIKLVMFLH